MPNPPTPILRWPRFEASTAPFKELYDEVTRRLRNYASRIAGAPVSDDYKWFNYLIDEFKAEYELWATDPRLRDYLERVDPLTESSRALLHTYLHICFDLP